MALRSLVKREIKAFLKNPGFIVSIILLLVFFVGIGGVMRESMRQAVEQIVYSEIGVVLEDEADLARILVRSMNETLIFNGRLKVFSDTESALENTGIAIVVPRGFADNVTRGDIIVFRALFRIDTLSTFSIQSKMGLVTQFTTTARRVIPIILSELNGTQVRLDYVVEAETFSLYGGKVYNASILLGFLSFILMLPLYVGIVVGINAGYGAQLVAFEKTEKAFEMLMAQPVKRRDIVVAKIVGSSVATLIFGVAYVGGMILMVTMSTPSAPGDAGFSGTGSPSGIIDILSRELGFNVSFHTLISIGVAVVLGLLQAGTLGVILGALAPDERTAGILTTPITMLYIGIALVFSFMGFELNTYTAIVSGLIAIPFPLVYLLSILMEKPLYAWLSIIAGLLFFLALVLIANYLFNRDIVILGLRISIGREQRS